MELSQNEFDLLRKYIYELCGIALNDDKQYLIRNRLGPVAKSRDYRSFFEYYNALRNNLIPDGRDEVLNAITTNETAFFRDKHLFDAFMKHVLPYLADAVRVRKARSAVRKGPKVRIWSAGASTGQEPYSVAMMIHEYVASERPLGVSSSDFGILATDVSSQVLAKGVIGEYSDMEISKGLGNNLKTKYFLKSDKGTWLIVPPVRQMVEFRYANLIEPFDMLGGFDVVFCRNVLCYFDNNTKKTIFDRMFRNLSNDGFLIVGATESVYPITDKYAPLRIGGIQLYRKAGLANIFPDKL